MVERGNADDTEFGVSGRDQIDRSSTSTGHDVSVVEARLDAVLGASSDGIVITNDKARVLAFNPSCEHIFGYASNEVVGHKPSMLLPDLEDSDCASNIYDALGISKAESLRPSHEIMARHKNGSTFPIEVTLTEAATPSGPQHVCLIRKQNKQTNGAKRIADLQQQVIQLSRRNAIDEMNAAMAHELNQPLTAMMLYLQAVERKTRFDQNLNGDVVEILDKALRETKRASEIIQSMRRFGKKVAHKNAHSDICQHVLSAVELTRADPRAAGIAFETNFDEKMPEVQFDGVQIEQVLINLLRNAVEAVEDQTSKKIKIRVETVASSLNVSVTDSGPGVPKELVHKLFEAFSTSKTDGMGLGLAISKTIAESHGGYLDFDPGGDGAGAAFTLRLPLV